MQNYFISSSHLVLLRNHVITQLPKKTTCDKDRYCIYKLELLLPGLIFLDIPMEVLALEPGMTRLVPSSYIKSWEWCKSLSAEAKTGKAVAEWPASLV